MDTDRERWNSRYAAGSLLHGEEPSRFLAQWLPAITPLLPGRRALDLACGEGRNSLFLARQGFQVTGIDISPAALAKGRTQADMAGLTIDWQEADLDSYHFDASFDLIININFLQRRLLLLGVDALAPGGVMLVDTILAAPQAPIPHDPLYLLQPGELARIFSPLPGRIIHGEEHPEDATPTAKIIFQKQ